MEKTGKHGGNGSHEKKGLTKQPPEGPPKGPYRGKCKAYWHRFWSSGPDRHIELALAAIVAVVVVAQAYITWKNNASTTQQTEQLIAAAKYGAYASNQNALAARSFAESAGKINQGISNAVDKLNLQAEATRDLAEVAVSQARSAAELAEATKAGNRPYVGWAGIDPFTEVPGTIGSGQILKVPVLIRNFGPIVAQNVRTTIKAYYNGFFEIKSAYTGEVFGPSTISPAKLKSIHCSLERSILCHFVSAPMK
jgi:hypothetical protein